MSMPKIPDINPEICVDVEDALSVLIASIGFEELGLAHIINAEGEKIQAFLGTLDGQEVKRGVRVEELEKLDKIVNKTLDTVIKKELIAEIANPEYYKNPSYSILTNYIDSIIFTSREILRER